MRHHPLLHRQEMRTDRFPMKADAELSTNTAHCHSTYRSEQVVALGVLPVKVFGPRGSVTTDAFLDTGSDTTHIDAKLLYRFGLCGYRASLSVSIVVQTAEVKSEVVEFQLEQERLEVKKVWSVSYLPNLKRFLLG
ncbi:unnamed protein product [Dibothriocephalus latus]|uniref:Peptidase A2 domain-containing protein n=1 Tax=Dibothriocephalus latus TaxID=60516 RepID=A0A3P7QTD7_DIBLA|nr:unnamed protein product [Dibothriocephalus latus]